MRYVVAARLPGHCDAIDINGPACADVLVGEAGAGVAGGEAVARHAVVGEGDRESVGYGMDVVLGCRRISEGKRGDVCASRCAGRRHVFSCIRSAASTSAT